MKVLCTSFVRHFTIIKRHIILKYTIMLRATTKEQQDYVKSLVENESCDGDVMVYDDCIDYTVDCCYSVGISFDTMAKVVDYLRTTDAMKELFEECWIAYKRKGSKKKSLEYWKKLTDAEKQNVLPHIKAYVSTRDLQYQKDFERYLRDKIFQTVVFSGNNVVYDPTKLGKGESANDVYMPSGNFSITWDDTLKAYLYIGYYSDGFGIADGYTDDNRPDGATIVLNNGRGTIYWNAITKVWTKK